jgi:hypothetical protein
MRDAVTFPIPPICGGDDVFDWRRRVLAAARTALAAAQVSFRPTDRVTVEAVVALSGDNDMRFRDVDNLLKQVLDGLQGQWAAESPARWNNRE